MSTVEGRGPIDVKPPPPPKGSCNLFCSRLLELKNLWHLTLYCILLRAIKKVQLKQEMRSLSTLTLWNFSSDILTSDILLPFYWIVFNRYCNKLFHENKKFFKNKFKISAGSPENSKCTPSALTSKCIRGQIEIKPVIRILELMGQWRHNYCQVFTKSELVKFKDASD